MSIIDRICSECGFASYAELAWYLLKVIGAAALCYVAFVGLLVVL